MSHWSHPKQLVELAKFYEQASRDPESVSDTEFLAGITKAFWPTNCWSFVEAAFAIIAPGCAMRPHLARQLIGHPIEAMIAGGLEDPNEIIAQGIACATKENPYVEPSLEGRQWLLNSWPKLGSLATAVFQEKWDESSPEA
jgi:hypothetical protein